MDELSNHQYKLLKKLLNKDIKKSELTTKDYNRICELGKKGFISFESIYKDESSLKRIDENIQISPRGEAMYDTYIRNKRRWIIPLIISLISLIISIFAIYKSSEPIKIYLNDEIINAKILSSNDIEII